MITSIDDFNRARSIAEDISNGNVVNIQSTIKAAANSISENKDKKEFYDYIGSLLLNTILNREKEFGEEGVQRALEGRRIIKNIINTL
jgi:hypothetical protein